MPHDAGTRQGAELRAGSVYEAHIVKADGTRATVYVDASFAVTSTETGGPAGGPGGGPQG
jgi:hypothetical protein